jgi:hypothetical protein
MTTYQDPPLQSRRAVRQGERVDPPFTPPQTPRTAAGAGEPLSYVTQNRPPLPGYDTAPSHGRRSSAPQPQSSPDPQPEQSFRPRDYSPEARTAPPAWSPEDDEGVLDHHTQVREPASPHSGGSLAASLAGEPNEQTLTRRELRAIRDHNGITAVPTDAMPVVQQPVVQQPVVQQPLVEPPAGFAPPAAAPQQSEPPQQFAAPAPAPSRQLDSAMAEFDALAGRSAEAEAEPSSRRAGRRASPNPDVAPEDGLSAFDAMFAPVEQAPQAAAPSAAPAADQYPVVLPPQQAPILPPQPVQIEQPQPVQFEQPQPVQFQQPAPEQFPQPAPAQFQQPVPIAYPPPAPVEYQQAPPAEEAVSPTTGERPVGHWTNQSDLDDRTQVNESTISRRVGTGGAITTSALVLPSIPGHNMSTGEVMLTDSISLPSALAATGAHSPIDESDIDHLLDPGDHQMVNTDSVPIRAIRAVSSHSGSRNQLITTNNPTHGNRALTALIVSASGMVVVVVTLLVVALATEVI